jgi:hypothetical protein
MSQPMPRPEDRSRDRRELPQPLAYRSEGFFEDLSEDLSEEALPPPRRFISRSAQPWALALAVATFALRPAG